MKRTIIMLVMSAMSVLLIAPVALAQDPGGLSPSGMQTPSLPYQSQPLSPMQIQQGVGSIPQDATVNPDATASPEATAGPEATASPGATANPTTSPSATASPSASPTVGPTASPTATASVLADTGGPSLGTPIAVAALLVLLVSGIAVARVVRRPDAAS